MLESLIIILPTFLAFCFAASRAKSHDAILSMAIFLASLVFLWIFFFVMGWEWFETKPVPGWLSGLASLSACLTLPLAYLAVNTKIGKSHSSFSTFVLFLMIGLMAVRYGALSLDYTVAMEPVDMKNILFIYDGKTIGKIQTYSLVMLLQSIWILCRTWYLAIKLRENNLHVSYHSKIAISMLIAVLTFIIITICTPTSFWNYTITKYLHFTIFSAFFTILFISIGLDFKPTIILDTNDEPVYFDRKPRFEDLEKACRKLYDEEKIFLIPSLKLEDLAKRLNTNRTYTAELMKSSFKSTFAAYTNAYRVEEAKKVILTHPTEKMENIAGMCGFATAPTFTKVFKAATGLTPSAWLAQQLKEDIDDNE